MSVGTTITALRGMLRVVIGFTEHGPDCPHRVTVAEHRVPCTCGLSAVRLRAGQLLRRSERLQSTRAARTLTRHAPDARPR